MDSNMIGIILIVGLVLIFVAAFICGWISDDGTSDNYPSQTIPVRQLPSVATISSLQLEREANDQLPEYHEIICIEDLPTYHEVMNGYRHDNNSGIVR